MKTYLLDTSVLIDLAKTGALEKLQRWGGAHWLCLDLVIAEFEEEAGDTERYQLKKMEEHLEVLKLDSKDLAAASKLHCQPNVNSIIDKALIFKADMFKSILLTGDKTLRKAAENKGLEVHGSIWVIDEMHRLKVIDEAHLFSTFEKLKRSNPRLPQDELDKRINRYNDSLD
jgi:predicted nucleic acid-binding protein